MRFGHVRNRDRTFALEPDHFGDLETALLEESDHVLITDREVRRDDTDALDPVKRECGLSRVRAHRDIKLGVVLEILLSFFAAEYPSQKDSAEIPSTRRSGSIDIALSTASIWATTISSISRLKSSSLLSAMLGMRMRLM